MSESRRHGLSLVSIGAAACVACCAGPIVALLGSVSLAALASTLFVGIAGLVVAGLALTGTVIARGRRAAAGPAHRPDLVGVAAPTRKVSR